MTIICILLAFWPSLLSFSLSSAITSFSSYSVLPSSCQPPILLVCQPTVYSLQSTPVNLVPAIPFTGVVLVVGAVNVLVYPPGNKVIMLERPILQFPYWPLHRLALPMALGCWFYRLWKKSRRHILLPITFLSFVFSLDLISDCLHTLPGFIDPKIVFHVLQLGFDLLESPLQFVPSSHLLWEPSLLLPPLPGVSTAPRS